MKHFYHLADWPTEAVDGLVSRAVELRCGSAPRRFPGKSLGLLFFNPSLRTQASFQRAAGRLGLDLVQLSGGSNGVWGIETRDGAVMDGECAEHVRETAAVLGRYVDLLAVRAFPAGKDLTADSADPVLRGFLAHAGVPVLNLESALWHPCQALADWTTLEQFHVPRNARFVLTWAWHPKPLPHAVPNSTLSMAATRGMDVVLLRPDGFDLQPQVLDEARGLAAASGGSLTVTDDRACLAGAAVIYAKSWGSLEAYGDTAAEAALRAPLRSWCVGDEWLEAAGSQARFMHSLPVRRNVVVTDSVLDGPASWVLEQAENRLHAQTALLENLCLSPEQHSIAAGTPMVAS